MRRFVAAVLIIMIFFAGCSFQHNVPFVDATITPPTNRDKVSLRAAILVPDDNQQETRTFPISPNSCNLTIPAGKMIRKSAQEIFPYYFEMSAIIRSPGEADGFDLVFVPTVADFGWDVQTTGLATQHVKGRVSMKMTANDPAGRSIWEKTVTSPWVARVYDGLSTDEWLRNHGTVYMEATSIAMKDTLRQLAMSRLFQDYVEAKGGRTERAVTVKKPEIAGGKLRENEQVPRITDGDDFTAARNGRGGQSVDREAANKKLKSALEQGQITAEQVNRAMDELRSSYLTKTFEAFLKGEIDEKQFGELY